jgi:uncharacterized SAM-binding protein YcdF (DUF218 family)
MYILGKIAMMLLSPATLLGISALLAWFWRKKPVGQKFLAVFCFSFLCLTNPLLLNLVIRAWEPPMRPLSALGKLRYDAIILMGGMLDQGKLRDRPVFHDEGDRLNQALVLYRHGFAPRIIISAGNDSVMDGLYVEGNYLKKWLIESGLPDSAIWVEPMANNTWENAKYCKKMLIDSLGNRPFNCIAVTSGYHMKRSIYFLHRFGLDCEPWPAHPLRKEISWMPGKWLLPQTDALYLWHLILKEWIGIAAYRFKKAE